jgi:hypothetical protein
LSGYLWLTVVRNNSDLYETARLGVRWVKGDYTGLEGYMEIVTDWDVYRQASLDFLRGLNPMRTPFNYLPPWMSLLIAPVAILPRWAGYVVGGVIMLMATIVAVKKLKGDLWTILLVSTTPFLLHNLLWGNLEWVPLLGMLLPSMWGLIWISAKPQSGAGVVLYDLAQVARRKMPITVLLPFGVTGLLALLLYQYPFSIGTPPAEVVATASYDVFPVGVPVGLALIAWAIKHDDRWLAYAASPLLMPYFTSHTLIGPFLVPATRSKRWAIIAWIIAWAYTFATPGRV